MRSIAVILPYAVSIRDFVHTGVFSGLLRIPDVRMDLYTQNPDLPEFGSLRSERVALREIGPYAERPLERLLRKYYPILFHDIFVYIQQNVDRSPARKLMAKAVALGRRMLGTRLALRLYGWLLLGLSSRPSQPIFAGSPDLVIGTRSLVNSLDFPFMVEAARRRLPLLTIASSWDNFTTKGFFPFAVAKTVVWNRKMAEELVEIFEVPRERIVVAGYPRAALIGDAGGVEDARAYLERLGLGQYRRFVLHTASYAELTRLRPGQPPQEYRLVREVAEALLPTLPEDTCIIVRLHPFSEAEDEALFEGLPRLHVFVPGRKDRYVERVMSKDDEIHLACQLKFSECIVSMASTITIDALAVGRPVINLCFDPSGPVDPAGSIPRFYRYNHFRDLLACVRPPLATSVDDVVEFVAQCMAGEQTPQADLAAFERYYVPRDSLDYARVVRETVEELLAAGTAALEAARTDPDRVARR